MSTSRTPGSCAMSIGRRISRTSGRRASTGLSSTEMREIYAKMAELEREGRRFALCTVVRTVGSTPQVVGAKLIVDDLGRLTGTLGGGCVEGDAFVEAKRVISSGDTSLREYELTED